MKPLRRPRTALPVLGYWPQQWPEADDIWHIFVLQLKQVDTLAWYLRSDLDDFGPVAYRSLEAAREDVAAANSRLMQVVDSLAMSVEASVSLQLKVENADCRRALIAGPEKRVTWTIPIGAGV